MKTALFESDYAPGTFLRIVQTDDGDIVLKVRGDGEMRIATSGGKLHGDKLVACIKSFSAIIAALALYESEEKAENCCVRCFSDYRGCGGCESVDFYKGKRAEAREAFDVAMKALEELVPSREAGAEDDNGVKEGDVNENCI